MFTAAAAKNPKPQRRSREEMRQGRRQQILEAAWTVYLKHGYEDATVEAVAEQAGITRMPIYTMFGDKQNLYFELSNMFLEQVLGEVLAPLQNCRSLRHGLTQLASWIAKSRADAPEVGPDGLFHVVQVIALSRPDIAARQREGANQLIAELAAAIRAAKMEAGDRLRGSAEQVASLLAAQLYGLSSVEHQTGRNVVRASDLTALFHAAAFR